MKVYALSDLHLSGEEVKKPMDIFGSYVTGYIEEVKKNWNDTVENEDIVLISGDISWAMYLKDANPDLDFIGKLKGKKVIIQGNHDYWWKSISSVRAVLQEGTHAIQNDSIRFDGTRGWKLPESSEEASEEDIKIYNREVERMRLSLKSTIGKRQEGDVLIVMMHFPPRDYVLSKESNFTALFSEYKVNKVVYGHLHGQHIQIPLSYEKDGIEYYLTSCDKVNNKPIRIL
jgi:uncharacterized protein